jgi:UDP-N-acetylmuramate: L-alanyl-gamma-D-glutamyl-meso-diaminopimelate ligase
VFQDAYAEAFDAADQVVIARPYDQSRIAEDDRFDSDRLVRALADRGIDALALPDAGAIAATVAARAHPHDVVAILSNGGFDGLHAKLLALLEERFTAP